MVLLILAVIWAAVLIPPALRSRAEGRPADSITNFHRQLAVLRRAGPRTGRYGDWMSSPFGRSPSPVAPSFGPLASVSPIGRPARVPSPGTASMARRTARRRRRDIFLSLLVACGTTLVLGAIPALRFLWLVHVAADVLLISYVALLIRQRNLATERDLKVRLLPTARRHQAQLEAEGRWVDGEGGWLAEPVLLRRSAT